MEPPPLRDAELRSLVERIKRKDCVLVLGPRVAIRPGEADRRPLDELLACEILTQVDVTPNEAALSSTNLRRAADLYLRLKRNDRVELELAVQDFYSRDAGKTTDFHTDLAALPFRLCICATPDDLMLRAYEAVGKAPQRGHYNFKEAAREALTAPTPERPLVYHLFGHHEDPESLVLSELNLIDFIVSVVKGVPPVPDQVRSILKPEETSFLFLGFGFQHWYLRVLLRVFAIYNRPKLLAFEDSQFFDHPEHEEAIGFFSEQQVEFRPLRWEAFAKDLRRVYEASVPRKAAAEAAPARAELPANAPKAFLSYASEDREAVDALAAALEARGIRVWQDVQDLRVGDNWNDKLFRVIDRLVNYVVVVQTKAMLRRIEGVFHEEIAAAKKRQARMGERDGEPWRFLMAVRIGDCGLLSALQSFHVIDAGTEEGVDALARSILEDWERRAALEQAVAS